MGLNERNPEDVQGVTNNKGTDQLVHTGSLISAFVILFLENTMCKRATGEFSIFLASLCS